MKEGKVAPSQLVTIFLHPKYPHLNQKAKSDFAAQAIYAGDDLQVSQLITEDGLTVGLKARVALLTPLGRKVKKQE